MGDNKVILLSTVIRRNENQFIANKLGEEMVMMNMENGDFISLNNVGADIWDLCGQPLSVQELIRQLLSLYDITEEQCTNETIRFLQNSLKQNMFMIQDPNNAGT